MYPYHPLHRHVSSQRNNKYTMKVKGEGSISTSPDQAEITIGAVTEDPTVSTAQQENAGIIGAITSSISGLGIPEDDIQTIEYRIETQYDYVDGKQVFRGYRVTHLLHITIDDIELTGQIIDTAVSAGANSISSIQFSLTNPHVIYNQALELAIQDAQRKAETIAQELGVNLDTPPKSIREVTSETTPIPYKTALYAAAESTPIQPGTLSILAKIEAEFYYG
ncbi:SIMPL domain-containing protein [Alteribacter populi]|uniref:SIMPL domain-containing protein n=1 Tax=Alteribacter populi TaxID=2011011 RepID=UPI000BBADD62|nr:SIMPL domain-containing protein [Alteribacter populi]